MTRDILIVRLSAIGDTIHSIPLAAALKKRWPDCRLGWVVEAPSAPLIVGNPLVDWPYVVPKGWLKSPRIVWTLRNEVRRRRFEIVFDPQGLTKSAVVATLSGARERIGFTRGESRELAPWLENRLVTPEGVHAVDKTLSLLRGVDEEPPPTGEGEFVLPACGAEDLAEVETATEIGEFALMGPWGSFVSKLWPLERFRELAERLHNATGMRSLMLGHGEKERGRAAAVCGGALGLAPDVGILGVVELCRRAALFVGCDSFPMHAAAAAGSRTLGLFGVTDPRRLGPYGSRGAFVYERLTLPRSTRARRELGNENMAALRVEKVYEAALSLLRKYPLTCAETSTRRKI